MPYRIGPVVADHPGEIGGEMVAMLPFRKKRPHLHFKLEQGLEGRFRWHTVTDVHACFVLHLWNFATAHRHFLR
ncbi:hypothetical protein D3C71_2051560 [compost metagenome]